ncbi:MAG TPA: cupin domain-containing protein [Thermoanaerobaculia bacterium]|nr:cupin domain-containing protein [Thermoanaerobaculia bacterium]
MRKPMKSWLAMLSLCAVAVGAAEIPGFLRLRGADLSARFEAMPLGQENFAVSLAGDFGSDLVVLVRRMGAGEAEWHEKHADVFFVRQGKGTLVIGGTLVDARETGPGERRADGIAGGERVPLEEGDFVRIPAGISHQVIPAEGPFDYVVLKIVVE